MSQLLCHVEQGILVRRLFAHGQRILAAVSGGPDSMVLLRLLHGLAPRHGWQLTVAHLNHRLRGRSSDADERLVRRTAERLGLPVRVGQVDVRSVARTRHLSLEMAARDVRHDFLARTAAQFEIPTIALAHHADDHLELFFLRLLRGTGGEGLGGMKWRNPSPVNRQVELVRPLLDQPKSALFILASELGVRFREDASNGCLDIQRNRIRHELLPLLRANYQPALDRIILRTADILGAEADFAIQSASDWLDRRQQRKKPESTVPPAGGDKDRARCRQPGILHLTASFDQLPLAVQRHVVRLQLLDQGVVADYSLVEQLRRAPGTAVDIGPRPEASGVRTGFVGLSAALPGALDAGNAEDDIKAEKPEGSLLAVRDPAGAVRLKSPQAGEFSPESVEVALEGGPGKVDFGGAVIGWRIGRNRSVELPRRSLGLEVFDADKVGSPIRLRHWRPGDRFQPIGMAVSVKLQDLFTNLKVPQDQRRRLIVAAAADGEVFWVEGVRISERFKLSRGSIRRLKWRWERAEIH